jgi:hypothetical protein
MNVEIGEEWLRFRPARMATGSLVVVILLRYRAMRFELYALNCAPVGGSFGASLLLPLFNFPSTSVSRFPTFQSLSCW